MEELFMKMVQEGCSDLHLSTGNPPLFRKDGEIVPLGEKVPLTEREVRDLVFSITPRIQRQEFDARHDTDFAHEVPAVARFRCNLFMDRMGIGGVFRQIPSKIPTAEELGLSKQILQLCDLSKGLVLVTGPTGSGKSTTLAALIDHINRNRTGHIITIEDPIEFVHLNQKCLINQREVGTHTEGFKEALRAALREDPDCVLVGEMRDLETIAIAIETAETGHLVFGTLHTNTAASTVDRMIDQFPADRQSQVRTMLSESLKGVISQTLCKKKSGGRVARAGGAFRDSGGEQPDPGREDLPDPLHHADRQGAGNGHLERRPDRAGAEGSRRPQGGLLQVRGQGGDEGAPRAKQLQGRRRLKIALLPHPPAGVSRLTI